MINTFHSEDLLISDIINQTSHTTCIDASISRVSASFQIIQWDNTSQQQINQEQYIVLIAVKSSVTHLLH